MDVTFLVRVRCMTYNHASYIEDAMNGFCMQKTSFPFVCIIMDDASTDGEQEVIKRYLQEHFDLQDKSIVKNEDTEDYVLTFARHKKNNNCYFAVFFLKYNHYRKKSKTPYFQEWKNIKYVAICEGDDYWFCPDKLQVQVDYMEAHSDCSLCFHDADCFSMHESKIIPKFNLPDKDRNYTSKHLFTKGWFIATASILFRHEWMLSFSKRPDWARIEGLGGDITWQMFLSTHGHLHFISRKMSVYRFGVPGSATDRSKGMPNNQAYKAYLQFLSSSDKYLFNGRYKYMVWYKYFRFYIYQRVKGVKKLLSF